MAKLKAEAANVGWDRWFQIWLGEVLCKWADEQAKAELGTAEERAEQGLAPHWLSQQNQRETTAGACGEAIPREPCQLPTWG